MEISEVHVGRAAIAAAILDDLPDWFGIPEARRAYVADADTLPMWVAWRDGAPVGFLSLRAETATTTSVHVIGVRRAFHRGGCGRALIEAAALKLTAQGTRNLSVKTLGTADPDPNYAATRRFYGALGFEPIEEFPNLWGAGRPCLLMVRRIG